MSDWEAWRPQPRLRHVQSITVRSFTIARTAGQQWAYYELSKQLKEGEELVYRSEKVDASAFDLEWDSISSALLRLPADTVHAPLNALIRVCVFLCTCGAAIKDPAAAQKSQPSSNLVPVSNQAAYKYSSSADAPVALENCAKANDTTESSSSSLHEQPSDVKTHAAPGSQAECVLDFLFGLNELQPIDEVDFKHRPASINQLLLELSDGYYSIPVEPHCDADAGAASYEHHSLTPALHHPHPIQRQPSLGPQSNGSNFAVSQKEQQQQLYKWMVSNTGAVEPLSSSEDVPTSTMAGLDRMPSIGLSSLLSSVFFGQPDRSHQEAGPRPASQNSANNGKPYDVLEMRAEIRRMIAASKRLHNSRERKDRIKNKVCEFLEARRYVRQKCSHLGMAHARIVQSGEHLAQLQVSVKHKREQLVDARKVLMIRLQILISAVQTMKNAQTRLLEAEAKLQGPSGAGLWRNLHSQLVGRRNRLVSELESAYQIGPMTMSPLDYFPLEIRMDQGWSSSITSTTNPQSKNHVQAQEPFAAAAARLAIAGLELPLNLAKRGLQGNMGWNGDYDEEERVAAGLGYVAHVVDRLSGYLDVPLRFPIIPRSSRSLICDFASELVNGAAAARTMVRMFQSVAVASRPAAWKWPKGAEHAVLPLYYEPGDRTRFAYAIFLLNKDIEQLLNAHGLASAGPTHMLANLYKLLASATSALPQTPSFLQSVSTLTTSSGTLRGADLTLVVGHGQQGAV